MAQRLSFEERARVEAMAAVGVTIRGDCPPLGQGSLDGVARDRPQQHIWRL